MHNYEKEGETEQGFHLRDRLGLQKQCSTRGGVRPQGDAEKQGSDESRSGKAGRFRRLNREYDLC